MYSHHRNSYLQLHIPSVNPRVLNRAVDAAMERLSKDDLSEPPLMRLCSEQPCVPIDNVDVTRRDLPFGRWALPILYKKLHSTLFETQIKAINSLGDLVHDPEKGYEAIRLGFVRRLIDLLIMNEEELNVSFIERIILALKTLAGHALGREAMLDNLKFVKHLLKLMELTHDENIRCKTAALTRELTSNYIGCCTLIDNGFVRFLLHTAFNEVDDIAIMHLESLERLFIEIEGQERGFDTDALEKIVTLLSHRNEEIVIRASRCLKFLVSNELGKDLSVEYNLLIKLNELLHNENPDVYTAAASVIMFATLTVKSKHDAAAIHGLPQRLARLTSDHHNPAVQMFCMKALTNMCELPEIKEMFHDYFLDQMKNILTNGSEELETYKSTLIKIIKWKPWKGFN